MSYNIALNFEDGVTRVITCNEGETVLDNCMGSGSTGVAALNLNRKFIGIEKEKEYFDIATKRISKMRE